MAVSFLAKSCRDPYFAIRLPAVRHGRPRSFGQGAYLRRKKNVKKKLVLHCILHVLYERHGGRRIIMAYLNYSFLKDRGQSLSLQKSDLLNLIYYILWVFKSPKNYLVIILSNCMVDFYSASKNT